MSKKLKKGISEHDLQQTIDFWDKWLFKKKHATIGEFMIYGARSLEACKELINIRAADESQRR